MPSFLLNGAGGYIITETGGRIIIDSDADLFDEIEVFTARSSWQTQPGLSRWAADDAPSAWRAQAVPSSWEVG